MGPWVVFSMVAIVAFLGMVATRTSLDRSAIELARIEADIAEARAVGHGDPAVHRLHLLDGQLVPQRRVLDAVLDQQSVDRPREPEAEVLVGICVEAAIGVVPATHRCGAGRFGST